MAISINKGSQHSKKKGQKKKVIDPYSRKIWYQIKVPSAFSNDTVGLTIVNRTQGKIQAEDQLMGRVFSISLGDLQSNDERAYQKYKFIVNDVTGRNCITEFHSMEITTDKLRSIIRKWQTLLECHVDLKTSDGYVLRFFCISTTKRQKSQVKKCSYATNAQVKRIRKRMTKVLTTNVNSSTLEEITKKLISESISTELESVGSKIFPLQNTLVRKVKVVARPTALNRKPISKQVDYGHETEAKPEHVVEVVEDALAVPVA